MFLKQSVFKKLLKQAYKSDEGLVIQRTDDWIELMGDRWTASILKKHIPKETLGEIIALVGELPEEGQRFSANKNGNQFEMNTGLLLNPQEFVNVDGKYLITRTYQEDDRGTLQRVLQDPDTGKLAFISNTFAVLLDESEAWELGETFPYHATYKDSKIHWANQHCRLQIYERKGKYNERVKEELAGRDLNFGE